MLDKKIAIVGAGPGGLTLGLILQKRNIPFVIFESDESPEIRDQGGSLDLHPSTGQAAIKECGLYDEFTAISRPEGDYSRVVLPDGTVLRDENLKKKDENVNELVNSGDRPEIDRKDLRDLLLKSIDKSNIIWGKRVSEIRDDSSNKQKTIHFVDGESLQFDLVVGADGAWSKVRRLISDVIPHYSSITLVELWAFNVSKDNPELSDYTGAGTCFMIDENKSVISQRCSNDSIRIYVSLRVDENWQHDSGINWDTPEAARQQLVDGYFNECAHEIKDAIISAKDNLVIRPLYMLPIGYKWVHQVGVTLLGDSAHLMTPFAGEGVNTAMFDALELANAITSGLDLDTSLRNYEKKLFKRAKYYAKDTWRNVQVCFSKNGGEKLNDMFSGKLSAMIPMLLLYVYDTVTSIFE